MKLKTLSKDRALSHPTWRYLADIASFCALIYESDHKDSADPVAHYSKPEKLEVELYAPLLSNWTRIESFPKLPELPDRRFIIGGLVFDIWHTTVPETESELVILIFRGSDTEVNDWWTNLRWITRFVPFTWDQYLQVIQDTSYIVDHILKLFPDATIISAGHSLGGGLATAASYCSPRIQTVYAFNSSPVTGYFSVSRAIRMLSRKELVIFRIYEKGEILAYARGLMKWLWPLSKKDPEVISIQYNFTEGDSVQQHSMSELAKNLQAESITLEQKPGAV